MAEKDISEKLLEDYNDVFADIYNTLLFEKPFIEEAQLENGPTTSIYKKGNGKEAEQIRDVMKNYKENSLCICSLGIENQTGVDHTMPVRVMGYDYGSYRTMLKNNSTITPVTTIVLNFGDKCWSSAKSLHEMMQLPEDLKPYVENYKIRVYDIAFLSDNIINKFRSDFKVVAKFFKQRRLGRTEFMTEDDTPIKHVEAVSHFLSIFTKDERYRSVYTECIKPLEEKGESISMCHMLQYHIDKAMEKGLSQGLSQGLKVIIGTLKPYIPNVEDLHKVIIQNEIYADVTREQVQELYEEE